MKRILDKRLPSPADYGRDERKGAAGDGSVRDLAPGQAPAAQADVEEQAGQVLQPMVFPGPLAFRLPPVMLGAPDAPNASNITNAPDLPAVPARPVLPFAAARNSSGVAYGSVGGMGVETGAASLSALVDALERNDFDRVRALIRSLGIPGDPKPGPDEPPLLYAARLGHLGLVEALLAAGAQVNLGHPRNGRTALMIAARNGYAEIVRHLVLQPGIECDKLDAGGYSALIHAAAHNRHAVLDCLLDAGAQINLGSAKTCLTALIIAAGQGHVETVKRILVHPAVERDKVDALGYHALMQAAHFNRLSVVNCLLDAGMLVNFTNKDTGCDALMRAASAGHVVIVKSLLAQPGIELDKVNAYGNSALIEAAYNNRLELANYLLNAGAQVNLSNGLCQTALMRAAEKGHVDIVRRLLAHPAIERDRVNGIGDSALMIASEHNHLSVVNCLLDAGAPVNFSNPRMGWTAMIRAAMSGHVHIVRRLLAHPAIELDRGNNAGESALNVAARCNKLSVVDCLLDAGAQVNLGDAREGETALMQAASRGYVAIVKRLLAHPAIDRDKLNVLGESALMLACSNNHPGVAYALLNAGARVNLSRAMERAIDKNSAALAEVLFRHGARLSGIAFPSDRHPECFVAAVEDLSCEVTGPAPALSEPGQAQTFFIDLIEGLTARMGIGEGLLKWLRSMGLRSAYARQLLAVLNGAQAPWKTIFASKSQKIVYCLSAISLLPALDCAAKMRKTYRDAGTTAGAAKRLGDVASTQLNDMASLAASMLAGIGSKMTGALVDGCLGRTNSGSEFNADEFAAGLISQGYCAPVSQVIVLSWQDAMSAPALQEGLTSLAASGTTEQQMAVWKDHMARHAPAQFAQALSGHLASSALLRRFSATLENSHDEVLHAVFQVQCDQLRQLCEQLLEVPASGAAPAPRD